METVIREGTLRLQTNETSCDVILNCQGHRLMAHKIILSIASPIFRDLFGSDSNEPTIVILPDVNANTMSLILDYIYTGSVIVYSSVIQDFLSVANLLKLKLDENYLEKYRNRLRINEPIIEDCKKDDLLKYKKKEEIKEQSEQLDVISPNSPEVYSKKNQRKLPSLVPLNTTKLRSQKTLCNLILPSPWTPRIATVLSDPREDYAISTDNQIHPYLRDKFEENDSNNNLHYTPELTTVPKTFPATIREKLTNFYLNRTESLISKDLCLPFSKYTDQRYLPHTFHAKSLINSPLNSPQIFPDEPTLSSDSNKSFASEHRLNHSNPVLIPTNLTSTRDEGSTDENSRSSLVRLGDDSDETQVKTEGLSEVRSEDDKTDKQKPFKCVDCGKSFSQLRNYKYHRSVHEGTKEFAAKCPECGKIFNDRGYLSSHMKIHRDRKEYACPHCPKRFNQRVAYNMHLRIHTGVKPHECPTCGKSFSRKMLLKQHQRVHTGERPYSCPECGKTFADRSNMSLHARLHTGVKPYACNLCPKSFTKKHHLKTHMNFHTGLKPYTCENCGLAFSQSSNMRTHYKKCILKEATSQNNNNPPG